MQAPNTVHTHSDQKYINALIANDAALVEEIYQKYAGKIKAMVLKNGGNEDDAADIFQDTLLALYNKAQKEQFTLTCPLDAFIYMIAKNKWLNHLNKRKTQKVTFGDTEGYSLSEDIVKLADICGTQHARKKLLEEKLGQLGESCRNILQMSWSGKRMDEIAALLEVSYGYARKKKSECMGKLVTLVQQSPQFKSLKW